MSKTVTGKCCCGEVSYRATNPRQLWYCHCEQCRRMTGHHMAAIQVDLEQIEISGEPKWHYVSENSRHGFCPNCGSQMFWRNDTKPHLSLTAGTLDNSEGLEIGGHVFCGEKGDYYEIPEGEKHFFRWDDTYFANQ